MGDRGIGKGKRGKGERGKKERGMGESEKAKVPE
jgi:hypothetical protein